MELGAVNPQILSHEFRVNITYACRGIREGGQGSMSYGKTKGSFLLLHAYEIFQLNCKL